MLEVQYRTIGVQYHAGEVQYHAGERGTLPRYRYNTPGTPYTLLWLVRAVRDTGGGGVYRTLHYSAAARE